MFGKKAAHGILKFFLKTWAFDRPTKLTVEAVEA